MRKLDGFKVLHAYESAASMAIAHPRGGMAEVLFESPKHATAAIKKLDGSTIHDATLKARRRVECIAIADTKRARACRIIIRNLHFRAMEEDLLRHFGRFGPLREAHIPKVEMQVPSKDGGKKTIRKSRGFAFVQFVYKKDAVDAVENSQSMAIRGREVAVDFALAKTKFERESKVEDSEGGSDEEELAGPGGSGSDSELADRGAVDEASAEAVDADSSGSASDSSSESSGSDSSDSESSDSDESEAEGADAADVVGSEDGAVVGTSDGDSSDSSDSSDGSDSSDDDDDDDDDDGDDDKHKDRSEKGEDEVDAEGDGEGAAADGMGDGKAPAKPIPQDVGEGCTLFVRNVPFDCKVDDIKDLFAQYGDVSRAYLVRDKVTGLLRGSAFVKMETASGAENALKNAAVTESSSGIELFGRQLIVAAAVDRREAATLAGDGKDAGAGRDRRFLYLANEGLVVQDEDEGSGVGVHPQDAEKRARAQREKKTKLRNPLFFVNPKRLSVRNLAYEVDDAGLRKLADMAARDGIQSRRVGGREIRQHLVAEGRPAHTFRPEELQLAHHVGKKAVEGKPGGPALVTSVKVSGEGWAEEPGLWYSRAPALRSADDWHSKYDYWQRMNSEDSMPRV